MKQNEPAGGGDDGAVTSAGLRDGVIAGAIILPVNSYGAFEHETFLDLRVIVLGVDAAGFHSASGPCVRRSRGRREASSTWCPERHRATHPRLDGEPQKVLCCRYGAGSLPTWMREVSPETSAPATASGGVTRRPRRGESQVRSGYVAPPPTVRWPRALPAQTRPRDPLTLQAFTSSGSRHSFNLATARRIVDFIVPRGTAKTWASSACDSPK